MGLIYNPIHKLRKDNMKTQQVNTTAEQFKLITDKKGYRTASGSWKVRY